MDGVTRPDPVLRLDGVSATIGGRTILREVRLTFASPGLVAVVGPMGSGKSTLLKMLAGRAEGLTVTAADGATVPVASLGHAASGVRFVPQKVRDAERSAPARLGEIEAALGPVGAPLLIDEPTSALTKSEGMALMARLAEIATARPVLVVTHNMREVRAHADRVVLLEDGAVAADLPAAIFFAAEPGTTAARFLEGGGLAAPSRDSPAAHRSPEWRAAPPGLDRAAPPVPGEVGWILDGVMGLCADPPAGASRVVVTDAEATLSAEGSEIRRWQWAGGRNRPDLDIPAILRISAAIEDRLRIGPVLLIEDAVRPACLAAIAGGVVLRRGAAPDLALGVLRTVFPGTHFGMRFEQMLWDVDLALGMVAELGAGGIAPNACIDAAAAVLEGEPPA
jgi:energy-coupling factor transporter ATP-binding protein EcfA2